MSLVKTNGGCSEVKSCVLRREPSCSGVLIKRELTSLSAIVKDYIRCHRKNAQMELGIFERYVSFGDVLEKAGSARTPNNKKYTHQQRISQGALKKATQCLNKSKAEINKCGSFEDLHEIIFSTTKNIAGIGPLYVYDTALRIGANLKIYPKIIYLHCGTMVGAKNLGLITRGKALCKEQLPKALQELQPNEIENLLCIYRDCFSGKMTFH